MVKWVKLNKVRPPSLPAEKLPKCIPEGIGTPLRWILKIRHQTHTTWIDGWWILIIKLQSIHYGTWRSMLIEIPLPYILSLFIFFMLHYIPLFVILNSKRTFFDSMQQAKSICGSISLKHMVGVSHSSLLKNTLYNHLTAELYLKNVLVIDNWIAPCAGTFLFQPFSYCLQVLWRADHWHMCGDIILSHKVFTNPITTHTEEGEDHYVSKNFFKKFQTSPTW